MSAVIQSPSLFLRKLDSIIFAGGGAERCSFVAEGLGRAMKVFDDISNKRNQRWGVLSISLGLSANVILIPYNFRESTKNCILVCSSPPHDIPCYDTREYSGYASRQVTVLICAQTLFSCVVALKEKIRRPGQGNGEHEYTSFCDFSASHKADERYLSVCQPNQIILDELRSGSEASCTNQRL